MAVKSGENYSQYAPTFTLAGTNYKTSAPLTVTSVGADALHNYTTTPRVIGTTSLTRVDKVRVAKYDETIPEFLGDVTFTVSVKQKKYVAGVATTNDTVIHYTVNGKSPTWKALGSGIALDNMEAASTSLIKKYKANSTYLYTGPVVFKANEPGFNNYTYLKIRAYAYSATGYGATGFKVDPLSKSPLILVKFMIHSTEYD